MLKKLFILIAVCVFGCQKMAAETEPVDLVGCMTYSLGWSVDGKNDSQAGFYAFKTDGSQPFSAVSAIGNYKDLASNGGAYGDGKYLCYDVYGSYLTYYVRFHIVDPNNGWKEDYSKTFDKNYKYVPCDMTYDYRSGKFLAVCYYSYESSESGYLCEVNPENGEMTELGKLAVCIRNFAADAQGQLWGIGRNGKFYKIGIDGNLTEIGQTDYRPTSVEQSATIDFRSGKYFWASNAYKISTGSSDDVYTQLLQVDMKTAEATNTWTFDQMEQITGLTVLNTHPDAPDNIEDLRFVPVTEGQLQSTITFTVPNKTYCQQSLTGDLTLYLWLDGELVSTETITAGSTYTKNIEQKTAGNHTVKVQLVQGSLKSLVSEATTYFGYDVPEKASDVQLTTDADHAMAYLTWTAPTIGANGGYIDPAALTYRIVRLPDNVTVAEGISTTTYSEEVPRIMENTRYGVYAVLQGNESKISRSNYEHIGKPWELPLVESFESQNDFDQFYVIDANNDGKEGFESSMWKFDDDYGAAFYYGFYDVIADDWLITPALNFKSDRLYKLTFQTYGYQGWDNHLQITMGQYPTVEGQTRVLSDYIYQSTMSSVKTKVVYLSVKPGDRYVGFHNISSGEDHMSIDNIYIEDFSSAMVPDTLQSLTASETDDHNALLTFVLPEQSIMGEPLSGSLEAWIYRGSDTTPAAMLKNLKPGQEVNWTDTQTSPALNYYRVKAVNSEGSGVETNVSLDLTAEKPQAPEAVEAYYENAQDVMVAWTPSSENDDNVRYMVYRDKQLIAHGLQTNYFVDVNPAASVTDGGLRTATYAVSAVSAGGEGFATSAKKILIGNPYTLPFHETWEYQVQETNPWIRTSTEYAGWTVVGTGYDPYTLGQDGQGLFSCSIDNYYSTAGWGMAQTPTISFSNASNPHLSFYYFRSSDYSDYTYLQLGYIVEGQDTVYLDKQYLCKSSSRGWEKIELDLPGLAGAPRASILFFGGVVGKNNTIHMDNVNITEGTPAKNEVMLATLEGASAIYEGKTETYKVCVRNLGTEKATDIALNLLVDGVSVESVEISELTSGAEQTVPFTLATAGLSFGLHQLECQLTCKGDQVKNNNQQSIMLEIKNPNLPVVTDLIGERVGDEVHLTWSAPAESPEAESFNESFEEYESFAIDEVGDWTLYDGDGAYPFLFSDENGEALEWPNNRTQQSFMVFNPSKVSLEAAFAPHSGDQCMICWAAAGARNDDWMISPRLSGEKQIVSFYIRGVDSQDNKETYDVLVSYTDDDPDSFISLCGQTKPTATCDWTLEHYALNEGVRYFAIRYTAYNQKGLMVDEVMYEARPTLPVAGYSVYADGHRINSSLITSTTFTVPYATDMTAYTVRTVNAERGESHDSNRFTLDPASVSGLTIKDGSTMYYDLQGRRVTTPSRGIYISGRKKLIY